MIETFTLGLMHSDDPSVEIWEAFRNQTLIASADSLQSLREAVALLMSMPPEEWSTDFQ